MKKIITMLCVNLHKIQYKILIIRALYYSILFKKSGENLKLWGKCYIKNPHEIELGNNVAINDGVYLNGMGGIQIGNNVAISAGAIIVSAALDTNCFLVKKKHISQKICIGSDVQIGAGAIILSGVSIGSNVIVGAGSVVTKDVESNCIVAGNPAKIIRELL